MDWPTSGGEEDYHPRHVDDDDGFRQSARVVIDEWFAGNQADFDAYIRPVSWALHENADSTGALVEGSRVLRLIDVERPPGPRLQVYFVVEETTAWRRWIQVDPAWAAGHRIAIAEGRAVP